MSDEKAPLHEQPFRMTIEHVFTIRGRGSVVVVKCISGAIRKGETVAIISDGEVVAETTFGVIMGHPHKITAEYLERTKDMANLILYDVTAEQVKPGMMLVSPETFDTED